MDKEFLNKLYKDLQFDNQCLLYNGSFKHELMIKIIGLSEANQKHYNEEFKTQKRVSYLMAECFQNIVKHREEDNKEDEVEKNSSFFMNRNSQGKHYIFSANLINNENIDELKQHIDLVNSLSGEELKELYKKTIKEGTISDKGGAGLGLIDMARKSGYKLDYSFVDLGNNTSKFYNQIVLDSGQSDNKNKFGVETGIQFHKLLNDENIMMVQKGDFSHDSLLPVLTIIERSILGKENGSSQMKNVYKVMVELLQNIDKHALTTNTIKDGIFSIAHKDNNYIVSTGNFIKNNDVDAIKKQIDLVNNLGDDELENLYSQTLMKNIDNDDECAGLGIITLAQISSKEIEYDFSELNTESAFFSIHVSI